MERMIETLRDRGITNERVLTAFQHVDRQRFIDASDAYADRPQSIGCGQTISQPYIVAYMLQELDVQKTDKVLEVGSGSGYVIALLAQLCKTVIGTEIVKELHERSRHVLDVLESKGVIPGNYELLRTTMLGAPEQGPYNKIIVSAAAAELPTQLVEQLADGGVMIIPVGTKDQWLVRVEKRGETITQEHLEPVVFVPLL